MKRIIGIVLLIALGFLLVLPAWSYYQKVSVEHQAQTQPLSPAQQVITVKDSVQQDCTIAIFSVSGTPEDRAVDRHAGVLDQAAARILADRAIAAELDVAADFTPSHVYGPILINATLPDGETRLVWARVWSTYPTDRDAIAYLDAVTGVPLVIYKGMYLGDPFFNNGCIDYAADSGSTLVDSMAIPAAVLWNVCILTAAGIVIAVFGVFRRDSQSKSAVPDS
jgi:hypothetical protein